MHSLAGNSCDSLPQAAILATQVLGAELQEKRWLLRHVGLVLLVGHDVKEDGHCRRSILQGKPVMFVFCVQRRTSPLPMQSVKIGKLHLKQKRWKCRQCVLCNTALTVVLATSCQPPAGLPRQPAGPLILTLESATRSQSPAGLPRQPAGPLIVTPQPPTAAAADLRVTAAMKAYTQRAKPGAKMACAAHHRRQAPGSGPPHAQLLV